MTLTFTFQSIPVPMASRLSHHVTARDNVQQVSHARTSFAALCALTMVTFKVILTYKVFVFYILCAQDGSFSFLQFCMLFQICSSAF